MNTILSVRTITLSVMTAILILCSIGCGSLRISDSKTIILSSVPDSAEVYLNSIPVGVTPIALNISNKEKSTFVFSKEGYTNATCELIPKTDGRSLGLNVLTGAVIGGTITGICLSAWLLTNAVGAESSINPLCYLPPLALGILISLMDRKGMRHIPEDSCEITLEKIITGESEP
ncbi:MAG: PEGA domain-containing protein [Bacteroidetes bacterium]|nr:PEGA domain-containing protein [Bacteroidota bacterium]